MSEKFVAKISIEINANKSTIWNALTKPELIRQYFFGTEALSEWKAGKPIIFRGEWEGKKYEDKGTIIEIEKDKILKYNYWSSMSGTPDIPENYANVTYELSSSDDKSTILTITQDGIATEESKNHSEQNWRMVLEGLKKLAER